MRLSHKRKLLHKKGIPQRAWIGHYNRCILRAKARVDFCAKFKEVKTYQGLFTSVRSDFFVNSILIREKRTGKVNFDLKGMFGRVTTTHSPAEFLAKSRDIHLDETNKFGQVDDKFPEIIPEMARANGGYVPSMARVVHMSPEPTMLMVPSRVGKGSALESMIKSSNGACTEVRNDLSNKLDKELSKPKQSILSVLKGKVLSFFK